MVKGRTNNRPHRYSRMLDLNLDRKNRTRIGTHLSKEYFSVSERYDQHIAQ